MKHLPARIGNKSLQARRPIDGKIGYPEQDGNSEQRTNNSAEV
jgi:hypothetical protein